MRSSTAKSIAAIALTGVGSALIVGFRTSDTPAAASTTTTTSSTGATSTGSSSTGSSSTGGGATGSSSTTSLADGTFTGSAIQEPWGTFQVQATVSGGQLTAVTVVAAPQDGHSSRINSQAVPILTQAVLAAQGTSVNLVSGATWTSESYLTSLQSALDAAQAVAQNAA